MKKSICLFIITAFIISTSTAKDAIFQVSHRAIKSIILKKTQINVNFQTEDAASNKRINEITLPTVGEPENISEVKPSVSHAAFNTLLVKHVSNSGVVNYKGFKNEQNKLKIYINTLSANSPQPSWTRNQKLAYWINFYNALTIDLLLTNYPITSIMNIDNAWDKKIITIDGESYTLNDIENKVIRPNFNEPRIHFAVNCGALSCPKLLNEAFVPEKLDAQLEKQTIAFINNTSQNKIDTDKVMISKIFEWYSSDFGNIIAFLNRYSKIKIEAKAKVSYLDYQWSLNGY